MKRGREGKKFGKIASTKKPPDLKIRKNAKPPPLPTSHPTSHPTLNPPEAIQRLAGIFEGGSRMGDALDDVWDRFCDLVGGELGGGGFD